MVVDTLQLPKYEGNFHSPLIRLECNQATIDANPGCTDCHYMTLTADINNISIRADARVATGKVVKTSGDTTNGSKIDFEVSIDIDMN